MPGIDVQSPGMRHSYFEVYMAAWCWRFRSSGMCLPTFRRNLVRSSSRIEKSKKNSCCRVLARHSATSVHTYQNTRCHNSEDRNFRSHPCEDVGRHSTTLSVLLWRARKFIYSFLVLAILKLFVTKIKSMSLQTKRDTDLIFVLFTTQRDSIL